MPTQDDDQLWREVENRLGMRVPEFLRGVCEDLEPENEFDPTPEQRPDLLADCVKRLQACFPKAAREEAAAAKVTEDERWQLLADIGSAFNEKYRELPVTAEYHGFVPMTVSRAVDGGSYPASERIQIDFDSRMSLSSVVAAIQSEWKTRFRVQGWVRSTRQLGERGLALVRFVCLETLDTASWRERMTQWNEARPEWYFKDVRAFQAAFRRAEAQLTGHRGGLLPLYTTVDAYRERDRRWREEHHKRIAAGKSLREHRRQPKEAR